MVGYPLLILTLSGALMAVQAQEPPAQVGEAPQVDATTISLEDYVRATPDGHLSLHGRRARFWAIIGGIPNEADVQPADNAEQREAKVRHSRADSEALIDRFGELGFNMVRLWRYADQDYRVGDGSHSDSLDYFVWRMKERGLKIWLPGISQIDVGPADAAVIDEPATAATWTAAMREIDERKIGNAWIARVWDPRMEAAQQRGMSARATHFNHYTGLRLADDPVFATWELTNEEWWIVKMMAGDWQHLPTYFKSSLAVRWHQFLTAKYGDETALQARWGFLLPGESLKGGTIGILPVAGRMKLSDAGMDPTAFKALAASGGSDVSVGRDDVNRHRGEDVIEFYLSLQLAHKQRLGDHLKSLGRSAKLSPLCYDTGIGYQIQSQYLHQHADAVAHDAYINGWTTIKENPRFPWQSGLEEAPRISQDVPWLEHNKIEGKPFFCYETQIQQPAKYRAEFPLRLLALASIQDWDIVCWHYWGGVGDITTSDKPFDKPLDVTTGSHPQGYHYTYDEVQNAMMRAAGLAFRQELVQPIATPTTFTYGRRSLYAPESMDYGASYGALGQHMLSTTYQYGVRIRIDPTREDDEVKGPILRLDGAYSPAVLKPTAQVTFDTLRGGLGFDAPGLAAFTGFFAKFGDSMSFTTAGATLSGVSITVPPEMPYPEGIAEEKYLGFALYSTDGKPLAEATAISCSLVSTSFNTGFKWGPVNHGQTVGGTLPVQVARVAGTVTAKALAGMTYTFRDWHDQRIGGGTVGTDGALRIPSDQPIWYVALTR